MRKTKMPRSILRSEKPLPIVSSPPIFKPESQLSEDEEWSSTSNSGEHSLGFYASKSASQAPPSEAPRIEHQSKKKDPGVLNKTQMTSSAPGSVTKAKSKYEFMPIGTSVLIQKERSPSPERISQTPTPLDLPRLTDSESNLADQILDSMYATSPSPKKQRHTLSLAERTRLSMSRVSHSQYCDTYDDCDNLADLPRLSIRPRSAIRSSHSALSEDNKHADLIERTRKSMAGLEAIQEKARSQRRRSMKDAMKKQRESSYFPRLEEEGVANTPSIDKQQLIEGDPDYESVFMSRPKIKTSPAVSRNKTWNDVDELGD
jgi:hypothetical protein